MLYLTVNPRKDGIYVGTRQRGQALAVPIYADPRTLWLRPDVGVMWTPEGGTSPARLDWCPRFACDTGCYTQGHRFDLGQYLSWLTGLQPYRHKCLFATAPDVVGDAAATLARALPVLPELRRLGYRAALVAQDGLTPDTTPWDAFDVLFVGGTTPWKLREATYGLVREAARRGKWTHMGRCNSLRRLTAARNGGYDSADGTCLRFNPPQYVQEIGRWMDRLHRQAALPLFALEGHADA